MIWKVYTYYYNSINRSEKNEKNVKILGISLRCIHDGSVWRQEARHSTPIDRDGSGLSAL